MTSNKSIVIGYTVVAIVMAVIGFQAGNILGFYEGLQKGREIARAVWGDKLQEVLTQKEAYRTAWEKCWESNGLPTPVHFPEL